MISGHGNIETAVAAIKQGAYDFIEKPFKADRLVLVAQRAGDLAAQARGQGAQAFAPSTLVGKSSSMNQLRQTVEKIAPTNSRILIVGPAGAGKEHGGARDHSSFGARQWPVHRDQCGRDDAGAHGARAVRRRAAGGRPGAQGRSARRGSTAARCSSTRSPTCRARPRTRSCGCWSSRASSASEPEGAGRRAHHLVHRTQYRSRDRCRQVPRGPLSPPVGGADPGAAAGRAARTFRL